MVPKVGASYVGKKLYDYLMAPPAPRAATEAGEAEESGPTMAGPIESDIPVDELDGQVFYDEEGAPLGLARRVADVAVYVVFDGFGNPAAELQHSLTDPEARLFWRTEDGRIAALIYVADPSRAAVRPQAMRADDI